MLLSSEILCKITIQNAYTLFDKDINSKIGNDNGCLVKKKNGSWNSSVSFKKFYLLTKKIQILFP